MKRLLRGYDQWYSRLPFSVAFATCAIKASASDSVAQFQLENAQQLDPARNVRFAVWGGLHCGCFQHIVYNVVYPRLFNLGQGWLGVAKSLVFEICIHFPLVFHPSYYSCKALFTGSTLSKGLADYRDQFWNINADAWKLWIPAQLITFSVIPPNFRIAWIALVSFFWLIVLSYRNPMVYS